MVNIDYHKIADGIEFYTSQGFKEIDVPWAVSKEAYLVTSPKGVRHIMSPLGFHVASAEQSFLELILNRNLLPGKYLATSPCFRDEKHDDLHLPWFMKVELINYLGKRSVSSKESKILVDEMIDIGSSFFGRYLPITVIRQGKGFDIVSEEKIELGSYGVRNHLGHQWVYGTGVAEPRLTKVLSLKGKAYHLRDIPKGRNGDVSKILEEVLELKDSLGQHNNIMALTEASDILGALDSFLQEKFPSITMKDLEVMSYATKRAFTSGRRI